MDIKSIPSVFEQFGMEIGNAHTKCPVHGGSDSVDCKIHPGTGDIVWKCHSCGEGGTAVDLYAKVFNLTPKEAIMKLNQEHGIEDTFKLSAPTQYAVEKRVELTATNAHVPIDDSLYFGRGLNANDADNIWSTFTLVDGKLMGVAVYRWNQSDGKKIRQAHFDGESWIPKGFPHKPVPLYHEHRILDADIVIVVEGEKCMDTLQRELDILYKTGEAVPGNVVVTTLVGGSGAMRKANWDILKSKSEILFLRDNDEPGLKLMQHAKKAVGHGQIINVAHDTDPEGYDIADWISDGRSIQSIFVMTEEVESTKSREEIFNEFNSKTYSMGPLEVKDFLIEVYGQDFDPIELDILFEAIKTNVPKTKMSSIKAVWKQVISENKPDYPTIVCDTTISKVYKRRIVNKNRMFWVYNGKYWENVPDDIIAKAVQQVSRAVAYGKSDVENTTRKALNLIRQETVTNEDVLGLEKIRPPIINADNGEIHIDPRTGEVTFKEHSPESFMTYCLNTAYDPDAVCPLYDKVISELMCGDEELIRHFEEVAGYMIQPNREFKNYFIFHGSKGNNGKTLAKDIIIELMGVKNVYASQIDTFGDGNHDIAAIVGKLMFVDDDVRKGITLNDGLLKQISETKMMTANPKNKDTYSFISYAAIMMLCNHYPITRDLSRAMISRANITPFNAYFPPEKQDKHLMEKLRQHDMPGILNRFLAGLQRLRARGSWDYPEACVKAKSNWLMATSNLHLFCGTQLVEDYHGYVHAKDLHEAYRTWSIDEEGMDKKYVVTKRRFKASLEEMDMDIEPADNNKGGWKLTGYHLIGSQ